MSIYPSDCSIAILFLFFSSPLVEPATPVDPIFPSGSDGKASAYNMGDPGSFPGLGRSQAEGNGNPLQYSCLENPMDRGAWEATVHGVAKSRTQLSDFTLTLNFQNTCEASTSNSQNHSRELHSRHHTPANTNM